jgi:hypothetical protein
MKKIKCLICAILVSFSMLFFSACGLEVKDIELILDNVNVTYKYGEDIDLSNLKIKVYYKNDTKVDELNYNDSKVTIDYGGFDKLISGNYYITVSYEKKVRQFVVSVGLADETGIELDTSKAKLSYAYGEDLDLSNLVVRNVRKDNTKSILPVSSYTIDTTSYNKNLSGSYTISVKYKDFEEKSFVVTVAEPKNTGIEINDSGVNKELLWGEKIDLTQLVVYLLKEDNSKTPLTSQDYTIKILDSSSNEIAFDKFDSKTAGTFTFIIGYSTYNASFNVSVANPKEDRLVVDLSSYQNLVDSSTISVENNVEPDWSKLLVYAHYQDNSKVLLTSDNYLINKSSFDKTKQGKYVINITSNGFTTSFYVAVDNPVLESFTVDTSAVKLTYDWKSTKDSLDLTGLKIIEHYKNIETPTVITPSSSDYTYNDGGFDTTQAGTYVITIEYKSLSYQTFEVVVNEPKVDGITLDYSKVKTSYVYGTDLDISDITNNILVYSHYEDNTNSSVPIDNAEINLNTSSYNKNIAGTYVIKVTYDNYTSQFNIVVQSPAITDFEVVETLPDSVPFGTELDTTKIKVYAVYADGQKSLSTAYTINYGGYDKSTPNIYTISITFTQLKSTKTFTITVNAPQENGFVIDTSAVKTSYAYNEDLNLSSLVVKSTYEDNSTLVLTSDKYTIDFSSYNKTKEGTYTISVSYSSYTAKTFTVTVAAPKETGFRIDRKALGEVVCYTTDTNGVKTGVNFDSSLVKVYSVKENGDEDLLPSSAYTIDSSSYIQTTIGTYTIIVTYKTYNNQTFTITVKESAKYVKNSDNSFTLYNGKSYQFSGISSLAITNNVTNITTYAYMTGTIAVLDNVTNGTYTMNYIKDGVSKTNTIYVVDYISSLNVGTSYQTRNAEISSINANTSNYLNSTIVPQYAGTLNAFKFDILALGENGSTITSSYNSLFDYTYYNVASDDSTTLLTASDVVSVDTNGDITFNNSQVGNKIRVEIKSKYQSELSPITMDFVINNAYNVYTDADLKLYYGDLNVKDIDIQRDIVASYDSYQLNSDGSPINVEISDSSTKITMSDDGTKVSQNRTGNVYLRYGTISESNTLTVNGNYFNIDASKLPVVKANIDNKYNDADQPGALTTPTSEGYSVACVMTGLFNATVKSSIYDTTVSGLTTSSISQDMDNAEKCKVVYNNLTILGNSIIPTGDPNDSTILKQTYEMSGGVNGLRSNYCDAETNNVVINNCLIGLYYDGVGADLTATYTRVTNSWANNAYSWNGSKLTLVHSVLKDAGGSSVWLEDRDWRNSEIFDPEFSMDDSTIIENYVSGTEPWFVAHSMSTAATSAKTSIDGVVSQFSSSTKSIVKTQTINGTSTETFNFAVVIADKYSTEDIPNGSSVQGRTKLTIGSNVIQRTETELSSEARSQSGTFVSPVGSYSSTSAFNSAVQTAITTITTAYNNNDATIKATVDGYATTNSVTTQVAIQTIAVGQVMGQSFSETNSKYIEVITSVSGLGKLTFLTEFFNK